MSRCTCGCHDVETSVEKLQSLLTMESHLDEEMDELERLYQLDQLKYEWLMREGYPDLCDIIKEQMQKTESLLRMYSPMLQDTCAEKEAHITHILTMQRQRRLIAIRKEHQQHEQIQQENLQEQTLGVFPEHHFAQNDLLQYHSMLNGCQMQSRHLQYLSTNTRFSMEDLETSKTDKEKSSHIDENVLRFQQRYYRGTKRRFHGKILHNSKEWRRKKLPRCTFSGIQEHCSSSNISLQCLKSKAVCTRALSALGKFRRQHSISKGIQRKRYHVRTKNIKLSLRDTGKEKISERSSSGEKLLVSTNTTQLMKLSLSDQKMSNTKRLTNSTGKNLVSCNPETRTKLGNKSKSLHRNLLSILKPHQKQNLPRRDPRSFLFTMPNDTLHKNDQYSKFKEPRLSSPDQGKWNPNECENPNRESRSSSPRLNRTGSGLIDKVETRIVTLNTDISREEQNPLSINDYVSPNSLDGFDLEETDYLRE